MKKICPYCGSSVLLASGLIDDEFIHYECLDCKSGFPVEVLRLLDTENE